MCFSFVVYQFNLLLIIKAGTYLALKPEVIENARWHACPFQRLALEKAENGVNSFSGTQRLLALQRQDSLLKTEFSLLLNKPTT